jgi:hypothetical protein
MGQVIRLICTERPNQNAIERQVEKMELALCATKACQNASRNLLSLCKEELERVTSRGR